MQMHYYNTTTSLTQFLPSGPSCISQPSIHTFLSTFFLFILGCVFENLFTASCHWLSRWLQMCGLFFFLDHLCGTNNCQGVFSFFKSFCMVTCILCIFFFFNFLIFSEFCWIKNHRFVRSKNNILLNFIKLVWVESYAVFLISGHKYLSLYDAPYVLMFVC